MKIHMDDEPTDYTKLWASIMEEATGVVNDNPQPLFGECLSFIVKGYSRTEHDAKRLSALSVASTILLVFTGLSFFAFSITLVESLCQ